MKLMSSGNRNRYESLSVDLSSLERKMTGLENYSLNLGKALVALRPDTHLVFRTKVHRDFSEDASCSIWEAARNSFQNSLNCPYCHLRSILYICSPVSLPVFLSESLLS